MIIKIQHNLSKDESKKRVKKLILDLQNQYSSHIKNSRENWTEDSGELNLTVNNFDIYGLVQLKDSELLLDIKIPFFANMFKNRIKAEVESRLKSCLN